jgi:hypothetical protein
MIILARTPRSEVFGELARRYQAVMAIGGIEKVRFVVRDTVVAEHLRDWGKENVHFDPVHYLALLERKPGALDFGKPFDDWDLPESFGIFAATAVPCPRSTAHRCAEQPSRPILPGPAHQLSIGPLSGGFLALVAPIDVPTRGVRDKSSNHDL